jgi:L-lactate dehydrogenase complex protein LldG
VSVEKSAALFMERAALAAAGTIEVADGDALSAAVPLLVQDGAQVYSPLLSPLEQAAMREVSLRAGSYTAADATVEEVQAAIAETGSIVCASVEGRAVQSSLLPSHHIAIVPAGKIYATLEDFFASLTVPPTNLAIITGPSRTADIELTLAIGVHGPERLDVIVVSS